MSNDGGSSVTAGVVVSSPAQLRLLLETHASVLALANVSDSELHLDFRQPLTPTELPAFTWLSIIYLCSKQRSWQPAHEERHKLPPPVWQWVEELAFLDAPQTKDIADVALSVFAELRNVCLSWIAPVGLRRAASIWNAAFTLGDEKFRMSDELLRTAWFTIRGPALGDFRYKDEVRLELDPELIPVPSSDPTPTSGRSGRSTSRRSLCRPLDPPGSIQAENTSVVFRRKVTYFQPCMSDCRWIANEKLIFNNNKQLIFVDNIGRRHTWGSTLLDNQFFVFAVGILWAVERAQRIQDVDDSHTSLPKGLLSSVWFDGECSEGKTLACVQLEMSHPFHCAMCLTDDRPPDSHQRRKLRNHRSAIEVGFPWNCPFIRCKHCWKYVVHTDCYVASEEGKKAHIDRCTWRDGTIVTRFTENFECPGYAAARQPQASLAHLPEEILHEVLKHLTDLNSFRRLSMTCRAIHGLLRNYTQVYGDALHLFASLTTQFTTSVPADSVPRDYTFVTALWWWPAEARVCRIEGVRSGVRKISCRSQ